MRGEVVLQYQGREVVWTRVSLSMFQRAVCNAIRQEAAAHLVWLPVYSCTHGFTGFSSVVAFARKAAATVSAAFSSRSSFGPLT